ncbi:hypothetical protein BH11BAC4_BH11BAC4_07580 [soil metagenome]
MKNFVFFIGLMAGFYVLVTFNSGCAQISAPTGGARDTLPPRLVKAVPEEKTVGFVGNKVTLTFNEYVDLQELQNNLLISPLQKKSPQISYNLKTITIKFKDSLLPNTTYSVDFGNAIKDVNEGNVLKNFTYVFSTGKTIDSLTLTGSVLLAETGKADSTMVAMLYRNTNDTAVQKIKPDYITRVDGSGNFTFKNLPDAEFMLYALKDGDGGKTYNSKTELFAFHDTLVNAAHNNEPIKLFAFAEQKDKNTITTVLKPAAEKKLKHTNNLSGQEQDLLFPLEFTFNNPLKLFDSTAMHLTDTNYIVIPNYTKTIDSTQKKIIVSNNWLPETDYYFIMPKESVEDSAGNFLAKSDSLRFKTKKESDYGTILIRFSNLRLTNHPVIQFVEGNEVKFAFPLTSAEWSNKRFPPGEYTIRILYDSNNNGIWDPGNYSKKIQPENVIPLEQKIPVKAGWDNERDIKL